MCRFASITAKDSSGGRGDTTVVVDAKNDSVPLRADAAVAGSGSTGGARERRTLTAGTSISSLRVTAPL